MNKQCRGSITPPRAADSLTTLREGTMKCAVHRARIAALLGSLAALALACSGREPPGIRTFDGGYVAPADTGPTDLGVRLADASDARADVFRVQNGGVVPDFALPDLNPRSSTYRMTITPSALRPKITAYYFANAI